MRIDVLNAAPQLTGAQAVGGGQAQQAAVATAEESVSVTAATATALQPVRNNTAEAAKIAEEEDSSFLSAEEVDKLINRGNSLFEDLHLNEQFQLRRHDKLPRTMIRLVDIQQDRVIREFPPKKYLDLVAALQELTGLMLDERV